MKRKNVLAHSRGASEDFSQIPEIFREIMKISRFCFEFYPISRFLNNVKTIIETHFSEFFLHISTDGLLLEH